MMSLTLMRAVVDALDEAGHSALADTLAAPWGPDARPAFFRASANVLFTFEHAGAAQVLRCVEPARRSVGALAAEIALLRHLHAADVPVNRPVATGGGQLVATIPTALGVFNATAFERVPGAHLEFSELAPAQIELWGRALGRVHGATAGFAQEGRPGWQDRLAMVAAQLGPDETAARQALALASSRLHALPTHAAHFGLIHGDFELDNLLWDGARFVAIDFDDCSWSWFAADIAFALRDAFADSASRVDLAHPALQTFVAGYRAEQPLPQSELEPLPLFLMLHHLITFARVKRSLAAAPQSEPDWIIALRERLARRLERYRAEFAAFCA